MATNPAPDSSLGKAAQILKEIQSLWPTVENLTLRLGNRPEAGTALCQLLIRIAALSKQFNSTVGSLTGSSGVLPDGASESQPIYIRFPHQKRGKAIVEFGNGLRFKVEMPRLEAELLAALGEGYSSHISSRPDKPHPWVPADRILGRLAQRTGRTIQRHYLQQLIYRLKLRLGEFNHAHLIQSSRSFGYRVTAKVHINS